MLSEALAFWLQCTDDTFLGPCLPSVLFSVQFQLSWLLLRAWCFRDSFFPSGTKRAEKNSDTCALTGLSGGWRRLFLRQPTSFETHLLNDLFMKQYNTGFIALLAWPNLGKQKRKWLLLFQHSKLWIDKNFFQCINKWWTEPFQIHKFQQKELSVPAYHMVNGKASKAPVPGELLAISM